MRKKDREYFDGWDNLLKWVKLISMDDSTIMDMADMDELECVSVEEGCYGDY